MDEPEPPEDPLTRLDPDAAASARHEPAGEPGPGERTPEPGPRPAIVDVRAYRWAIGIIGLAVVIGFGVYGLVSRHAGSTGVPVGARLRWFAAPLAAGDLRGVANLRPPCTLARHDPRALNLCLDARRSPVVVSFFVTGSAACRRQVDALQALSRRYRPGRVQFLAVAVGASRATTARLVRTHHWTIPVAYDADGAVGEQYGVVVCPMAELAARGGIVRDRLIGERWQTPAALAPRVAALVR